MISSSRFDIFSDMEEGGGDEDTLDSKEKFA